MKKGKLTLEEKWYLFWGRPFLVNHNKKEIHSLKNKHVNCLPIADKNKQYVGYKKAVRFIEEKGFDGCRWCWNHRDSG